MASITLVEGIEGGLWVIVTPMNTCTGYTIRVAKDETEYSNKTHTKTASGLSMPAGSSYGINITGLDNGQGYYVYLVLTTSSGGSEVYTGFGLTEDTSWSTVVKGATINLYPSEYEFLYYIETTSTISNTHNSAWDIMLIETPSVKGYNYASSIKTSLFKSRYPMLANTLLSWGSLKPGQMYTLFVRVRYKSGTTTKGASRILAYTFSTENVVTIKRNNNGVLEDIWPCFQAKQIKYTNKDTIRGAYEVYYNDNGTLKQLRNA